MHKQLIITLLAITTACTAEWKLPEGYVVECENNSDCPDTAECTLSDDGTARVCVTDGETYCGNGIQEIGENCDDGNQENGDYCSSNCQEETFICGDGFNGYAGFLRSSYRYDTNPGNRGSSDGFRWAQ